MSTEEEVFQINVNICDRPYRLKVKRDEEEVVRKAAREISEKVKQLQTQFAGKDKQDYLAMHALTLAVSVLNNEKKTDAADRSLQDKLDLLDKTILQTLETST